MESYHQNGLVEPAYRESVKYLAHELLALDAELEKATPEHTSDSLISIAAKAVMLANDVLRENTRR